MRKRCKDKIFEMHPRSKKIEFLGHKISAAGITPSDDKVNTIRNFPNSTSVKQLQRFCGMINYYHRFIPQGSETMNPLDVIRVKLGSKKE